MSSIVADVLQSTGKLAKENIVLKINFLKRKLEDIKLEVQERLTTRYIEFFPQYVVLDKLINDINHITSEYDVLRNQIEKEVKPQMVSSVVEFNDVVEDLKRIKKLKAVALNLSLAHHYLEEAKDALLRNFYLNAVRCLTDFENALQNIDPEDQKDISIIVALKTESIVTKEEIIYRTETTFRERIVINSSLEGRMKSKCIKFNKTAFEEEDVEILITLRLLKQLKPVLREFGKQFLNVCETALTKTVKVRKSQDNSLSMTIINDNSPEPSEAFEVLKEVFSFLNEEFFKFPTTKDEDDESNSLMSEFGVAIADDFSTLIIEKCLKLAIPKQSRQLESFHLEIVAAENFCNDLMQMGFLSSSGSKLLSFIHEVDTLPVNKMAQDLLSRARSLMKKNLYQTVTVGLECPSVSDTLDASQLNEMSGNKNALNKGTFSFPKCQVSDSVEDLIKLLFDVKEEARNIDPVHAPRLYYVGRNICELYCCVVPTYHKEEIEKIPQQTAIYHNNCMYLAHRICILGVMFQNDIQLEIPMTFVDLVPEIRKLGIEAFLSQMRHQKQQLLQLLQEQQAYGSVLVDDGAVTKAEKAIRQCLCQLQFLKKVWSDVLPVEVYFKAIGTLFNTCLEEIILRITSTEDIAAEAAAQLDSMFAILLKQGPDLFNISSADKNNSVHFYVRRWFKFQELQLILSASMREIVDRWASGKGPLATHFTSEEVKRLIRALFQNTERRAAALAKIR